MDTFIVLLERLGMLSGKLQAAVDTEQWENAVLIGSVLELKLSEFRSAVEEKIDYCATKFKEANAQETAVGRRDVE